MTETISSLQNPQIKEAAKLKDAKERGRQGLILIEGSREISLALAAGVKLEKLFYCQEYSLGREDPSLFADKKNIINVSPEVFKKLAYREHPEGFLAVARPKFLGLADVKLKDKPLVIIIESVEKPGNLGAILRSADAAGVDAVIVGDAKTDIYNPNVIRASLGTVFANQVAVSSTEKILRWLKEKKIKSFATLPLADKVYTKADYTGPSAIVIGTEDVGLSNLWSQKADEKIKIDMKGKIDSLNASVSLAVVLFEALRQRSIK